jgi:hypothetical protein
MTEALAVISLIDKPTSFYQAWLHHEPSINSTGIGVRMTRNFLQIAANKSDKFPTREILDEDLRKALDSEGQEIMIFVMVKGAPVEISTYLSPLAEASPNIHGFVLVETGPLPAHLPLRPHPLLEPLLRPLPPFRPLGGPFTLSGEKLDLLSKLDAEHRKMMMSALLAGVDPELIGKPMDYSKAASDFSHNCFKTAQILSRGFDVSKLE